MEVKIVNGRISAIRSEIRRFINDHDDDRIVWKDFNDGLLSPYELGMRLVANAESRGVPKAISLMSVIVDVERLTKDSLLCDDSIAFILRALEDSVIRLRSS